MSLKRASGVCMAVGFVLFAAGLATIFIGYRFFQIPSESMTDTLQPSDRVLADKSHAGGDGVRRGDIVIFSGSAWTGEQPDSVLVKRVVGLPGDSVMCCSDGGRVQVNGHPVTENYARPGMPWPFQVTVPAGRAFVLGDNRPSSADSRVHLGENSGAIPLSAITGKVVGIAYPLGRFGETPVTTAFADAGLGPVPESGGLYRYAVIGGAIGLVLVLLSGLLELVHAVRARRS